MPRILSQTAKTLGFFLGVIVVSLSLSYLVLAWTEPSVNPPNPDPNISTPLNIGSTGQSKAGNLTIHNAANTASLNPDILTTFGGAILNTGGAPNGLIVQSGNVGIGTTSPGAAKLKISGGVLDLDSNRITNVSAPTASTDAATKGYVDAAGGGSSQETTLRQALQAISSQSPEIRVNAAMDIATSVNTDLSGTIYIISPYTITADQQLGVLTNNQNTAWAVGSTIATTGTRTGIRFTSTGTTSVGYTLNSASSGNIVLMHSGAPVTSFNYAVAISSGVTVRTWVKSDNGGWSSLQDVYIMAGGGVTSTIKSASIASDSNLIRYWERIKMNLSAGASTHATPLQIKIFGSADSYASALNSNWVTIPASEYSDLPLERRINKTATSSSQTTWDFTGLTGTDALINEFGAQYVLLVEQADDGSSYRFLTKNIDYFVDLTTRTTPRITLASGSGIVSGTSKLRATMVVDVLKIDSVTKNTGIKVQIQMNRASTSETSPSIQPLPLAPSQYVSADYVARY